MQSSFSLSLARTQPSAHIFDQHICGQTHSSCAKLESRAPSELKQMPNAKVSLHYTAAAASARWFDGCGLYGSHCKRTFDDQLARRRTECVCRICS